MDDFLQLKITLHGIKPTIWRRIIIPSSLNLLELHTLFQGAMGWQDYHAHCFLINEKNYKIPESDEFGPEKGWLDERLFSLTNVLKDVPQFQYRYDFGDDWWHTVVLEKRNTKIPSVFYGGFCVAGENACPPEDVGGISGYNEYVEKIYNSKHKGHAEAIAWRGQFFPEIFNPQQATLLMQCSYAWLNDRERQENR